MRVSTLTRLPGHLLAIRVIAAMPVTSPHVDPTYAERLMALVDPTVPFDPTSDAYWERIAFLAIPGAALLAGFLLSGAIFIIARCCCNSCGGRSPSIEGYTRKARAAPFLTLLAFTAIAVFACVIALDSNHRVSTAVGRTVQGTTTALADAQDTLGTITNRLDALSADVPVRTGNVQSILAVASVLRTDLAGMLGSLDDLAKTMPEAKAQVPSGKTYSCSYCKSAGPIIAMASTDVHHYVSMTFDSVFAGIAAANSTVVATRSAALAQLGSARAQLGNGSSRLSAARDIIVPVAPRVATGENWRYLAFQVLFWVPVASLAVILAGALTCSASAFRVNCCASTVVVIGALVVSTVSIPAAFFLQDACRSVNSREHSLLSQGNTSNSSAVEELASACFHNASLVDMFNVTGMMDLANASLAALKPIPATRTELLQLEMLTNGTSKLTIATFGFNSSNIDQRLFAFSTDPTLTSRPGAVMYNRSTLASAPVDAASAGAAGLPARIAAKANLMSQIDDEHLVTLALSAVKANVSRVALEVRRFRSNITAIQQLLKTIPHEIALLFDSVNALRDVAFCGSLPSQYLDVKSSVCTIIMPNTALLSLCAITVALAAIATTVTSAILSKRWGRPKRILFDFKSDARMRSWHPPASA
ncbi:unnamed protein product (mitochondrion) [Plasmodiophora brassicae]|uniref:Uncharacterized protein n=1 Tax=Plasmodiophora brassicae TaxID=37360 RepID=A0A3P3YB36_PLABS|nr:unnamed protein product [Plasmodiophora brassicae]